MPSLMASEQNLQLHSEADALDVMSSGLPACIFLESDLHPHFFDLANGIAGAALQKFVNYHFRVAIVVGAEHSDGERVTELMRDHRTHPCVRFFSDVADAERWLGAATA